MVKIERYYELEELCYRNIQKEQFIPVEAIEEMKEYAFIKSIEFQIQQFIFYNEAIRKIKTKE